MVSVFDLVNPSDVWLRMAEAHTPFLPLRTEAGELATIKGNRHYSLSFASV